jgi:uncharacterized protein DUF4031
MAGNLPQREAQWLCKGHVMAVYVDDMRARYGNMVMCHMLADSDEELHAMADRIGVDRRWHQAPPRCSGSHYDIALSKRALALAAGAIAVTAREAAAMNAHRRVHGQLGNPAQALAWRREVTQAVPNKRALA